MENLRTSSQRDSSTITIPVITRTSCRVCGSEALHDVLTLGNQSISNFLDTAVESPAAPLELVLCDTNDGGCGLLQLRHTADQGFLYRNYWYRSGVNTTMQAALSDVTQKAEHLVPLKANDIVIDTGSNDNTLLKSYRTPGIRRVGFEPATNLMPYAQDETIHVINDFFTGDAFQEAYPQEKAKIITSIAMFYDLENPNSFVADAAHCLDDKGLWIIQMMYLPTMLTHNIFDNICHEHLEYYSLHTLDYLLKRHGLKIIDVELNDVNGGSIRTYITHEHNTSITPLPGASERLQNLRQQEEQLQLTTAEPYHAFASRVEQIKDSLTQFIRDEAAQGKKIYVYGASTKGNTLLQYFGLDREVIPAAAERNPDKWGKLTVATFIPIISEEEARAHQPDYFLILPWHFLLEFIKREEAFLKKGGKFIVPLPEFKIIGAEAL